MVQHVQLSLRLCGSGGGGSSRRRGSSSSSGARCVRVRVRVCVRVRVRVRVYCHVLLLLDLCVNLLSTTQRDTHSGQCEAILFGPSLKDTAGPLKDCPSDRKVVRM